MAPIFIAPALHTALSKWGGLSRWIICSQYFLATFPFKWQWWIISAFVCPCHLYLVSPLGWVNLVCNAMRKHFLQQSGSIGLSALWRESVTPFYGMAWVYESANTSEWIFLPSLGGALKKGWRECLPTTSSLFWFCHPTCYYLFLWLRTFSFRNKKSFFRYNMREFILLFWRYDPPYTLSSSILFCFLTLLSPSFRIRALKKSKVEEKQQDGGGR